MIAAAVGLTIWQAWAITVGGIVSAAVVLTLLAKIPGGRKVFTFLIADPVAKWVDSRTDGKIHEAVKVAVREHVTERLDPIEQKIDQINQAVNNVAPGVDPIKDRVRKIEAQQQLDTDKLDTLTGMVESLIRRP